MRVNALVRFDEGGSLLIDIHSHLLYGVDDGPSNVTSCLDMVKSALASNTTHIIVTPHHMRGGYNNPKETVIQKTTELQALLQEQNLSITLFPGQEITLTSQLIAEFQQDRLLTLNHSRYMLIELPHDHIPKYTEEYMHELKVYGIVPIIAHPERNQEIWMNPERLGHLVDCGALSQVTASSLSGASGKKMQLLALKLCKQSRVHCIASDAHGAVNRPYGLAAAYAVITQYLGEASSAYFMQNAQRILDNEMIPEMPDSSINPINPIHRIRRWFNKE